VVGKDAELSSHSCAAGSAMSKAQLPISIYGLALYPRILPHRPCLLA
jgi:hypothetical protein